MANTNDELFEEDEMGGPDELGFEIDMAVEDALLADDFDENKKRFSTEILKNEEEDVIDISIGDEIQDEIKSGDHSEGTTNDEERNRERQRFKTERNIVSRPASSIPDSLDAVSVKTDFSQNRRGRRGPRGGGGQRQRSGGLFMPPPQMQHLPTSNIHVNPLFRSGALWDGQNQQQYQESRSMQMPYDPYNQPPPPPRFWPDGPPMPDYYQQNQYGPNDFYQPDPYYQQPNFGPPPGPPPNWDQNFYAPQPPPPHYQGPSANFQGVNYGPLPPPNQPQMRPHFNPGFQPPPGQFGSPQKHPKFARPNSKITRDARQDNFREKNAIKQQQRFENLKKNRNLQEIKTQDVPPKVAKLEIEEEDEDMKLYRLKIEEQKKLREALLKKKEEKRKMAAQQKSQEEVDTNTESNLIKVRLKTNNGQFIIKSFTPEQFARLKKISQEKKASSENGLNEPKAPVVSETVLVENLSASTTKDQLEEIAKTCGAIKEVTHDMDAKKATIRFETSESASEFNKKFHRKMVDLSMINVRLVQDIENE